MDYLNPGGVREELVDEMNLRLPDPLIPAGGPSENEPLGEARARAAAAHVLRVWLPRALEAQGMMDSAERLRQAGGPGEMRIAAVRNWQETRHLGGNAGLDALRECSLRSLSMSGWALSLEQGNPLRRRWRRGRLGEEAAAAGQAMAEVLRETGAEPSLETIYRELLELVDRTGQQSPPYVVDLMEITQVKEMEIDQFLEPNTPDALLRAAGYRSSRVLSRTGWIHGQVISPASMEELRDIAAFHLGWPGTAVQAALRNLPDPAGRSFFTTDLEAVLLVRHAHEQDIMTFIVEREQQEEATLSVRRMMDYHSQSLLGP